MMVHQHFNELKTHFQKYWTKFKMFTKYAILLFNWHEVHHGFLQLFFLFSDHESEECPIPNGLFLKPNSGCKEYYDCNNGIPTAKKCPQGLLFNQKSKMCDWTELVACPDDGTTTFLLN